MIVKQTLASLRGTDLLIDSVSIKSAILKRRMCIRTQEGMTGPFTSLTMAHSGPRRATLQPREDKCTST